MCLYFDQYIFNQINKFLLTKFVTQLIICIYNILNLIENKTCTCLAVSWNMVAVFAFASFEFHFKKSLLHYKLIHCTLTSDANNIQMYVWKQYLFLYSSNKLYYKFYPFHLTENKTMIRILQNEVIFSAWSQTRNQFQMSLVYFNYAHTVSSNGNLIQSFLIFVQHQMSCSLYNIQRGIFSCR